jgi:hypothetical protein
VTAKMAASRQRDDKKVLDDFSEPYVSKNQDIHSLAKLAQSWPHRHVL